MGGKKLEIQKIVENSRCIYSILLPPEQLTKEEVMELLKKIAKDMKKHPEYNYELRVFPEVYQKAIDNCIKNTFVILHGLRSYGINCGSLCGLLELV